MTKACWIWICDKTRSKGEWNSSPVVFGMYTYNLSQSLKYLGAHWEYMPQPLHLYSLSHRWMSLWKQSGNWMTQHRMEWNILNPLCSFSTPCFHFLVPFTPSFFFVSVCAGVLLCICRLCKFTNFWLWISCGTFCVFSK